MSNPASVDDIAARWQPLTPAQELVAAVNLDDAWALLQSKIADLDANAAADAVLFANVVRVECQMVLRVLKNPDGTRQTSLSIDDATRTWTKDNTLSSGLLYVSDEELDELSPGQSSQAFTIRQAAKPFYGPSADYPRWSPVNPYGSPACY